LLFRKSQAIFGKTLLREKLREKSGEKPKLNQNVNCKNIECFWKCLLYLAI
jgi:hypothetical protein